MKNQKIICLKKKGCYYKRKGPPKKQRNKEKDRF